VSHGSIASGFLDNAAVNAANQIGRGKIKSENRKTKKKNRL
jgi:hypothetical protein